jgi:hypothetical protein
MTHCIRDLTGDSSFDIVQLGFACMGQYAACVRHRRLVLHEHDVTYRPAYRRFRRVRELLKNTVLFLEWCRWTRYEPHIVRCFDQVFTVTEHFRSAGWARKVLPEPLGTLLDTEVKPGTRGSEFDPQSLLSPGEIQEY